MTPSEEEAKAAFKTKLRSLSFGFPYGREAFHDTTIAETKADIFKRAAENGYTPEPVGTRTYTGR